MYSVVVPTYNNSATLKATIESLLAQQTSVSYEIMIVDNNSTDDTALLAGAFADRVNPEVRYLLETTQGSSTARNAGIAAASGEIVAFTDDDCIPRPDWLESLAEVYTAHSSAWSVGGRIVLDLPTDSPAWFRLTSPRYDTTRFFAALDLGEGVVKLEYPQALWTANLSVRKWVFSEIGLFNTALGVTKSSRLAAEDLELCRRIQRSGGAIYYSGRATVRHRVHESRLTKKYFRLCAYWGGRANAHPLIRDRLSIGESAHEALVMVKDCAKMLALLGVGRSPRAFQCELAVRKRAGYLWEGWGRHLPAPKTARPGTDPGIREEVIAAVRRDESTHDGVASNLNGGTGP